YNTASPWWRTRVQPGHNDLQATAECTDQRRRTNCWWSWVIPDGSMSRSAASALARLGERRAIEPLLQILQQCTQLEHVEGYPDQRRLGAIEALGLKESARVRSTGPPAA